jgi:pyruvate/2-oxoglutarate dehydrogenase complex dihydrolipoamide dehydrogenase (E3) component
MMFDVVVIGGGPAGVVAALRARELGVTVALIERRQLGGVCVQQGCIPTRIVAKAARLMRDARQLGDYGIQAGPPQLDFQQLLASVSRMSDEVDNYKLLTDNLERVGVETFIGNDAHFTSPQQIELDDGRQIVGRRFIICTGGRPRRPHIPGVEHTLTSNDIWNLTKLPQRVIIIGGAATGCQLASVFEAFGAQVQILERSPRLLPQSDEMIGRQIEAAFADRNIDVITGITDITQIEKQDGSLHCTVVRNNETAVYEADAVITAIGWQGNIESLNLAAAGIEADNGRIVVDDYLQTSQTHIFAAGDVTGGLMLVQAADFQGRVAAENALLGHHRSYTRRIIPYGGFTDPEYASVGLTEAEARDNYNYAATEVNYADLDRAVIDGRSRGSFKLIVDRQNHRILGAHVVGEQAVEVVQIVAASMLAGQPIEQLATLKLAYPTYTAIVGSAARRLVRELDIVLLAPHWRDLHGTRSADWERGTG